MKTYSAKKRDLTKMKPRQDCQCWLIDASQFKLGRLAVVISRILQGKHKPTYTPHMDVGDYVVVFNSKKVTLSGKKSTDKIYYRHTGYPGGLRATTFDKMQARFPERALELAVKGMLPKGHLGQEMFKKLTVHASDTYLSPSFPPSSMKQVVNEKGTMLMKPLSLNA